MMSKLKLSVAMLGLLLMGAHVALAEAWPEACGKDAVQFKVKTGKKGQPLAAPEAGMAQVVFVEALEGDDFATGPTIRFGVDGIWVGADHGKSYFAVSVPPGTHHLCGSWQSSAKAEKSDVGVATETFSAGQVYYYQFKISRVPTGSPRRADGGAGGAGGGGAGVGNTPDMTVKLPDTIDLVAFKALTADEAAALMKSSYPSTSVAK